MKRVFRGILVVGIWLFITLLAIAAALIFESLRAFGPILYLLVIASVLGTFALWRVRRYSPRIAVPLIAIALLSVAMLVVAKSLSPADKYAI
jgi:hypothetical protein